MIERRVLLDAGPLVALLAVDDRFHETCVETLAALRPPLLTCWPVLTEVAWLLRRQPRPVDQLVEAHSAGMLKILPMDGGSLVEVAAIMRRYKDCRLQFADASLIHFAERERIRTVFTLDRRDFSIIRLKHNRALKLIP